MNLATCYFDFISHLAYFNNFVGHLMCDIDRAGKTFSGFWDFALTKKLLSLKKIGLSSSARGKKIKRLTQETIIKR